MRNLMESAFERNDSSFSIQTKNLNREELKEAPKSDSSPPTPIKEDYPLRLWRDKKGGLKTNQNVYLKYFEIKIMIV